MTPIMRVFTAFLALALGLALVAVVAAITAPVNVYDAMPIKCGYKLRETCPPTGVNWP